MGNHDLKKGGLYPKGNNTPVPTGCLYVDQRARFDSSPPITHTFLWSEKVRLYRQRRKISGALQKGMQMTHALCITTENSIWMVTPERMEVSRTPRTAEATESTYVSYEDFGCPRNVRSFTLGPLFEGHAEGITILRVILEDGTPVRSGPVESITSEQVV